MGQVIWAPSALDMIETLSPFLIDKPATLTIQLDENSERMLNKASRQSGKSRGTLAREALARHLRIVEFKALRKKTMPFAEARGYLSDEDLFRDIS